MENLERYADAHQGGCWRRLFPARNKLLRMITVRQQNFTEQLQLLRHASAWDLCEDIFRSRASRGGHVPMRDLTRLSTLLSHSRRCQSSNARDKAYAVLALADSTIGYDLPIDYTNRTTDTDVLVKLAKAIFRGEQRLDIMAMPSADEWPLDNSPHKTHSRRQRLPSWAPDWFAPLDEVSRQDRFHFKLWQQELPLYHDNGRINPTWGRASLNIPPRMAF